MIITLFVMLFVLVLAAWLVTMYAWWQKESGVAPKQFGLESVLTYVTKSERMIRRGYYRSMLYVKYGAEWSNKRMASLFFTLFPNAQPAFAKRDALTGLRQGPSSYFLMSISETKGSISKGARRRRKIV